MLLTLAAYLPALRAGFVWDDDYHVRANSLLLGVALKAQGRLEEATAQFAEALRLEPGHAQARKNFLTMLSLQGKRNESVRHGP